MTENLAYAFLRGEDFLLSFRRLCNVPADLIVENVSSRICISVVSSCLGHEVPLSGPLTGYSTRTPARCARRTETALPVGYSLMPSHTGVKVVVSEKVFRDSATRGLMVRMVFVSTLD